MGGKISKGHVTIVRSVNILGEFVTLLFIGKTGKLRCFKGVNINLFDMDWKANKTTWMTGAIMTSSLLGFTNQMKQ